MIKLFKKLPQTVQGILLAGGLMLTIFAIPMGYITIKDYIRKMKWENKKDERRPQLEADFANYQQDAELVYQNLQKLADQVELVSPYDALAEMPMEEKRLYDSLFYLKKGGISPFLVNPQLMPKLGENAFFGKAKDSQTERFIEKIGGYCGERVFYRIANGDWDGVAFRAIVNPDKEEIPTCMKNVATSKYFIIWQELFHFPAISSTISFRSGALFGRLDVYDIRSLKKVDTAYILARNSDSVYSFSYDKKANQEEEMKKALRRDLGSNTETLVEETFGNAKDK